MTRSGTTIWHEIMKSESVAKMPDTKMRLIFMGLLMACDDWGRFPDSPYKLSMSMPAFGITPDDISATIEWLDGECIERYTARLPDGNRTVNVCQFTNWEEYQWRLKSRDNAKLPSRDGNLEATTNPLALSRGDRTVTAPQPNEMKGKERKVKEKKTPAAKPPGKSNGNSKAKGNPVKIWVDLMKEIRDDIYKPNGPAIGNINNAFKHLNGDAVEFEKRVRLYLSSEYVKLPTPTKFYNAIENYKVGSEDKFFDEDVDF